LVEAIEFKIEDDEATDAVVEGEVAPDSTGGVR
jgi:hypothetical protein